MDDVSGGDRSGSDEPVDLVVHACRIGGAASELVEDPRHRTAGRLGAGDLLAARKISPAAHTALEDALDELAAAI